MEKHNCLSYHELWRLSSARLPQEQRNVRTRVALLACGAEVALGLGGCLAFNGTDQLVRVVLPAGQALLHVAVSQAFNRFVLRAKVSGSWPSERLVECKLGMFPLDVDEAAQDVVQAPAQVGVVPVREVRGCGRPVERLGVQSSQVFDRQPVGGEVDLGEVDLRFGRGHPATGQRGVVDKVRTG